MTTFPENAARPAIPDDLRLRRRLRGDGAEGFVLADNHQAVEPLGTVRGVQFAMPLDDGAPVVFPPRPVDARSGALWCFPVGFSVDVLRIHGNC
jgi:hypothetical protein